MDPIIISKNDNERVQVSVSEFQGMPRLDIRTYFMADDGEWHATKKGVNLSAYQLPELVSALNTLEARYLDEAA